MGAWPLPCVSVYVEMLLLDVATTTEFRDTVDFCALCSCESESDYGYWYNQGLLYPDLLSAMVALEPATKENGCLQLLRGTQTMGRIDHSLVGQQQGADDERVSAAMQRHDRVYATMEAGDVCFFHALTLHASAPNTSSSSRWALTCCYNKRTNDPIVESFHPGYTPLEILGDEHVQMLGGIAEWTEESDLLGADVNESQAAWAANDAE